MQQKLLYISLQAKLYKLRDKLRPLGKQNTKK